MPPSLDPFDHSIPDTIQPLRPDNYSFHFTYAAGLSQPLRGAFKALQTANEALLQLYSVRGSSLWECPMEVDGLVNPVVRILLSQSCRSEDFSVIDSCCRSAAILYLAELRRRSGISPVVADIHVHNPRQSLDDDATKQPGIIDPVLRLWLLTVGAIECTGPSDEAYFYKNLVLIHLALQIISSAKYRELLGKIVWFDAIFEAKLNQICERVMVR
jgi:hypothetical protein